MPLQVVNQSVSQDAHASIGDTVSPSGPVRDRRLTREDVPDEWEYPIFDAKNFIIEGPASVEIVDRSGQQIQMEAIADALDRYMGSEREPGIISDRHDDVPVGIPVEQWVTDGGDVYETTVSETEFTLVANIGNETTMGKLARLRCLTGDYGGYSVTVYSNQEHRRPDGTRVTVDCDLHAVTLGDEELVMNPAADFDVVDFKHGGVLEAAITRRLRRRRSLAGRVEQKMAETDSGGDAGFEATLFEVRRSPDDDNEYQSDLLGLGIDFPNADVYVDWNVDAWPNDKQLDSDHVSIYGSISDLEQATGNVIEPLGRVAPTVDQNLSSALEPGDPEFDVADAAPFDNARALLEHHEKRLDGLVDEINRLLERVGDVEGAVERGETLTELIEARLRN